MAPELAGPSGGRPLGKKSCFWDDFVGFVFKILGKNQDILIMILVIVYLFRSFGGWFLE